MLSGMFMEGFYCVDVDGKFVFIFEDECENIVKLGSYISVIYFYVYVLIFFSVLVVLVFLSLI